MPKYENGNVIAYCPDCEAITTFEFKDSSRQFGYILIDGQHQYNDQNYSRVQFLLLKCSNCGRGGIAKIHDSGQVSAGKLESFFPNSIELASIPENIPKGIVSEYRESELCASFGAWRAATALLRSTLEKTLKANGYNKGSLESKIDEAASDGIITETRKKRAHEDIRVLGNDVLHDEWRIVGKEEFELSHKYIQRILEDFYDDRDTVEEKLLEKGRIVTSHSEESAK